MIQGTHGILIRRARCPHCGNRNTRVYRSLPPENGRRVQYRLCVYCELRFKTIIDVPIQEHPRRRPRR